MSGSLLYFYHNHEDESLLSLFLIAGILFSFMFPVVLHFFDIRFCRFIWGAIWLLFMTPTFINVFVIYAIANLHDISWGNRPSGSGKAANVK